MWTTPATRATGDLITAAIWNAEHVNDLNYLFIASGITAGNVTTTGTTFAAGTDILATPLSFTADGVSPYLLEVAARGWHNSLTTAATVMHINLDGADGGAFAQVVVPVASDGETLYAEGRMNAPSAGSHTVNARVRVSSASTGTVIGGTGGAGNDVPIYVALRGA